MQRLLNIIKVIGYLLRNAVSRRSKLELSFHREEERVWYIDYPGWPFAHHNLAMVSGADKLCSYLAEVKSNVKIEVIASNHPLPPSGYGLLTKTYSNLTYGADYDVTGFEGFNRTVWICPVTLFVLGIRSTFI